MLNRKIDINDLNKKVVQLNIILFMFLLLLGCSPRNNPGDLSVAASGAGVVLSGSNNTSITYSVIYGTEFDHPDPGKSDLRYGHLNLLVSLFVLTPKDEEWRYVGGGNDDIPWYYGLIYNRTDWLLYPHSYFSKLKSNGTPDLSNKRKFSWAFNGKSRSISIAGNTYSISAGDYVLVKLDKHWDPKVGIGEEAFGKLQVSPETRNKILNCYMTIKKGIGALGKCK